jgi:hypothetical protein
MGGESASFSAALVQSPGFYQHDYRRDETSTPERAVYSALPAIVLSSTIPTSDLGRVVVVDGTRNIIVHADVVYVVGQILAHQRNIKIVARRLIFHGKEAAIVTDGPPGTGPESLHAPSRPDRAADGSVAELNQFTDKEAVKGTDGGAVKATDGAHGENGGRAGDIEIDVESLEGEGTLSALGGDGHAAQDGQDGQDGGQGGDGVRWTYRRNTFDKAPAPGGRGGDSGRGGSGGSGGDAGQITIRAVSGVPAGIKARAAGGVRGTDGKDGKVGHGGINGDNGELANKQDFKDRARLCFRAFGGGGAGPVGHGQTIWLMTFQRDVANHNILGSWTGNNYCYYESEITNDRDAQGWIIERADGPGDGKIRYGDRVYLTNARYRQKLGWGWSEGVNWLCLVGENRAWIVQSPSPDSHGEVTGFGDEIYLTSDGEFIADAPHGHSHWYPITWNKLRPPRERAPDGSVHDKPPGKDPWKENTKGQDKAPSDITLDPNDLCTYWHPAQSWLQAERLEGRYLTSQVGSTAIEGLGQELVDWQQRLTPLLAKEHPYAGTEAERAELLRVLTKLGDMVGTLTDGRDYFGNVSDWAPNPSFAYYAGELATELDGFKVFEEHHRKVLGEAKDQEQFNAAAKTAFDEAVAMGAAAAEQLVIARKELTASYQRMTRAIDVASNAKEPLRTNSKDVEAFAEDIKSFHCDLQSILGALEMMVFAPPVERTSAGAQALSPAGAAMAGVQIAKLIAHGRESVGTVDGRELDTKQVLTSVRSLSKNATKTLFDSASELYNDAKGRVYDVGGPAILATLDEWDELVAQFIDRPSAKALQHDIHVLAEAVRARGEAVVDFNDKLFDVLTLVDLVADSEKTRTDSLATMATLNNPGLPAVLGFLARHYRERKQAAIELVYLANRAYAYWMLDDGTPQLGERGHGSNVFREVIAPQAWESGDVYGAIDWTVLDTCRTRLEKWFREDLAKYSGYPTKFPTNPGADGFKVFVRDPQVIAGFRKLSPHDGKKVHKARIRITGDGKAGTFTNEHLDGLADVRLTAFRVFLNGAYRTGGDQNIQIQFLHDSRDQNFTVKGELRSFTRPELEWGTFIYNGSKDAVRYMPGDPGKFTSGFFEMDGAIGSGGAPEELPTSSKKAIYAGIGPFTTWTIILDPTLNSGIELGPDLEIEIQLVGVARTRKP